MRCLEHLIENCLLTIERLGYNESHKEWVNMTKREALDILKDLAVPIRAEAAFDMAIEALENSKNCQNIGEDYAEFDQFICSECEAHLQDWVLMDEDDEDIVHEYVFKYCPNCGAKVEW